jgi:MtfA peptidase
MLDKSEGFINGIPTGINEDEREEWTLLFYDEISKIEAGKSGINPYGATNKAEFFAVAVEFYKEQPKIMKKKHPKLFQKLDEYFNPTQNLA